MLRSRRLSSLHARIHADPTPSESSASFSYLIPSPVITHGTAFVCQLPLEVVSLRHTFFWVQCSVKKSATNQCITKFKFFAVALAFGRTTRFNEPCRSICGCASCVASNSQSLLCLLSQFVGVQVDVTSKTEGTAIGDKAGVPLLVKYDARLREKGKDNVNEITDTVQARPSHCSSAERLMLHLAPTLASRFG